MDKKKYWIIRLFFVLFTMSVSVAILPCGIIKVHSLFGEITTYICLTTVSTKRLFQKNCGIRCIKKTGNSSYYSSIICTTDLQIWRRRYL